MHNWYCEKAQHHQVNLYKLFVKKKGVTKEQLIECVREFKAKH